MMNSETYSETYPNADPDIEVVNETVDEAVPVPDAHAAERVAEEALGEGWPPALAQPLVRVVEPGGRAEKAPVLRRLGAGLIDRLLPLPFLAAFFWPWALVVLAYDLGRDAPGVSVGKRLLGLRTVMVSPDPALDGQPCTVGRSLLRNLLWAGSRLCYLSVVLSPLGIALDVTGCLMALLTPEGRHLGDRIGGTRVVAADRANRQGGTF